MWDHVCFGLGAVVPAHVVEGCFQPLNVREPGHAFEMGGISAFREWLLLERGPGLPRCAAASPLRAHSCRDLTVDLKTLCED